MKKTASLMILLAAAFAVSGSLSGCSILNKVSAPVFSIAGGVYYGQQTVALSTATPGATIYYTVDGTGPSQSSTLYSGAIPISATTTVRAIAVAPLMINSDISQATYTIKNVYVAGYEKSVAEDIAKYWKNGVAVNLTDGKEPAVATSILLVAQ